MNAITNSNPLITQEDRGVLRFITAGSVDDGKSTLIGRLLFDSKGIFADQLAAISRAKNKRTVGDTIDLSLLTDGLEAEREQGITIDVAYRYFATPKRKFIVADTPGHEQYTRNMVTGASTADAAIVLVDITRVDFTHENGALTAQLLAQTKRHTAIAAKLGLPAVIFAINKMDLVNFDQSRFQATEQAVQHLAQSLKISDIYVMPISALSGDNVVVNSTHTPWYTGKTLLNLLEQLPSRAEREQHQAQLHLRFPVQLVARHDGHKANDFRGYMGRIESGVVKLGDLVKILPSGESATVTQLLLLDQNLPEARAGQCITLVVDRDIDVSRGDQFVLANDTNAPRTVKKVIADLCWLDAEALNPARKYWLKQTTRCVQAKVQGIDHVLDIHTLSQEAFSNAVGMNDITRVEIALAQAIVADKYAVNSSTGSFILIDSATHQTAAAGMIIALE